ncbi:BCCT family transporter [Corynebacterium sputi]|uniref:BCCT family transporter n=1 Tax=Corynebacterium sputi TaxID=489915 RepID=UPI0003FDD610|nr:BCCT family transporter [Corynebacterium sputi]
MSRRTQSPSSDGVASTDGESDKQPRNGDAYKAGPDKLVLWLSLGFIIAFVAVCVILGTTARDSFAVVSDWLMTNLNWLYIGGVSIAFIFLVALALSGYGRVRLGQDGEAPAYTLKSWFAMLFAGGLGSVLMFFGVAEPINHVINVPMQNEEPMSQGAIEQAIGFTMYHFGLHMWVIFALPGLALGYFIYKRNLPPRLSSIFAPVLGKAIYSWPGKIIDALAIIGTVFGVAVSVGLGILQINAGLNILFGIEVAPWVQILIIVVIVVLASWSVAAGLDKGIKNLSNINILMAVALLLFVLVTGPTLLLMRGTMDSASVYAEWLPRLMFWSDSQDLTDGWQGAWTVFYWAWTICWAPFIGMFVARISRGRTIRQFVGGVLVLPTLFIIIWFSIFGYAALDIEQTDPGVLSNPIVEEGDTAAALFTFLGSFPWTFAVSIFALVIVAIFFVTSIDSAALVIDMFAVGEENVTPTWHRVMWAIAIGAVAGAILVMAPGVGIEALQEVAIIIGFPFFLIMFVMMYSLLQGIRSDFHARPEPATRQWDTAHTPESLEEQEAKPAPGYDEDGNALPVAGYDDEGRYVVPGTLLVEGDVEYQGDVNSVDAPDHDDDFEASGSRQPGDVVLPDQLSDGTDTSNDGDNSKK